MEIAGEEEEGRICGVEFLEEEEVEEQQREQ